MKNYRINNGKLYNAYGKLYHKNGKLNNLIV